MRACQSAHFFFQQPYEFVSCIFAGWMSIVMVVRDCRDRVKKKNSSFRCVSRVVCKEGKSLSENKNSLFWYL